MHITIELRTTRHCPISHHLLSYRGFLPEYIRFPTLGISPPFIRECAWHTNQFRHICQVFFALPAHFFAEACDAFSRSACGATNPSLYFIRESAPQDSRTINFGSKMTEERASSSVPSMASINISAAIRPISKIGCSTVVRGGL